jgi:pyridoxine 4-dehydrogenase
MAHKGAGGNGQLTAAASGTFTIGEDLTVNRLGFGAMRITGDGVWGAPKDHDEAIRVLQRAVDLGVDFIDTADSYGPEVSERLIAEALHPYPANLVIATKAGFDRPGPSQWKMNGNPEHLRKACEGSLKRLKVDRIDLYQLHRIDPAYPAEDQIGTFAELQKEGKIKHIGLSEVTVAQVKHAQSLVDIASVQNRYSVADRSAEDVLKYCEEEEIGFIPWFPLRAGKLAEPGGPLGQMANELGVTESQLALAWLLWKSPVMLPIPGTSSVKHLEQNLAAASVKADDQKMEALGKLAQSAQA